jgi:hypothetical protein
MHSTKMFRTLIRSCIYYLVAEIHNSSLKKRLVYVHYLFVGDICCLVLSYDNPSGRTGKASFSGVIEGHSF